MTDKLKPVRPRIVIDETEGPGGTPLQQCFFMLTDLEGAYNIYDSKARLLAAYVVSGADFNLTVSDAHFFISNFKIDDVAASGSFSIGHHKHAREADYFEPDGTFQASSSGGVEPDAVTPSVSATAPTGACVIEGVTGTSDKDKLKECYFVANGTTWDLYNKHGVLLKSGISSGNNFTFDHDKNPGNNNTITWSVTGFSIATQDSITTASGNWTNNDPSLVNEQSGSFQASSSGGIAEGQVASGASA